MINCIRQSQLRTGAGKDGERIHCSPVVSAKYIKHSPFCRQLPHHHNSTHANKQDMRSQNRERVGGEKTKSVSPSPLLTATPAGGQQ